MRILIDLQGAQSESRYRGIGRYSLSLARAAALHSRGHDIHVLLNGAFQDTIAPIRAAFSGILSADKIHVWYAPLPFRGLDTDRASQDRVRCAEIIREAAAIALAPDVIHVSSLFDGYADSTTVTVGGVPGIATVVTLYDLIPMMNPKQYLEPMPTYREFYERRVEHLRRADVLAAISGSASAEAVDVLGFPQERVFNISGACDEVFRQLPSGSAYLHEVREKFGLFNDFVLYTGGFDERKNLHRLVEAYAGLPLELRSRYRLVIAGRKNGPEVSALLAHAANVGLAEEELLLLGYVSDQELVALYNICHLFVFPSWHEGFGLPVLEAMSCGAAVIASDASSIREVATLKDALFDPLDVASIRSKMMEYIDNHEALGKLRAYSLVRAKDFSWDRVAGVLLDACESAARQRAAGLSADALARAVDLLAMDQRDPLATMAVADALDRSVSEELPTIFIDVSDLARFDHRTGIQRVTRAIVSEWMAEAPEGFRVKLIRIDREKRTYVCADAFAAQFDAAGQGGGEDSPLVCHAGDIFLGLDLVGDAVPLVSDWFEYFRSVGVYVAFVVYDILPVRHPEWWPEGGGWHHERWLKSIVASSDRLICISRTVAEDVRDWVHEKGVSTNADLKWFHLGADITASVPTRGLPADSEEVIARIENSDSFLMVGTIEPRKGHAQALAAFERLWAQGDDALLVIVGKRGWLVDALCDALASHPERGNRLFWLEAISDEYLQRVYKASSCLLAASEAEGFGLPLIEAAQRGKPVLARDIPIFREVAGEYASYFGGLGADALATAVLQWQVGNSAGAVPDISGLRWLTWRESAAQLEESLLQRDGGGVRSVDPARCA